MGRETIVTAPMITVRIEITMATIGRLIKNFDMRYSAFSVLCPVHVFLCGLAVFLRCVPGLWVDRRSLFHLLDSLTDHPLIRLESLVDDPHRPHSLPNFYRTDRDFVVAAHHRHLVAPL